MKGHKSLYLSPNIVIAIAMPSATGSFEERGFLVPFRFVMKSIPIAIARNGKNIATPIIANSKISFISSIASLFSNIGLLRSYLNIVKGEKYTTMEMSPKGGPA